MDDALYRLANDALSEEQSKSYFFAMRQLHAHEERITEGLTQRILEEFDKYWMQPPDLSFPEFFTENDVVDEFTALYYRFTFLKGYAVPISKYPLSSEIMGKHFKLSLTRVNLDTPIKMLAYEQFEKSRASHCDQLFHSLNQHLIDHDVVTKLRYKTSNPIKKRALVKEKQANGAPPNGRIGTPAALIEQLKVGDLLSRSDIEPNQKVQFAWQSPLTGRYIFNGGDGEIALNLNPPELKDWFHRKLLTPVPKSA